MEDNADILDPFEVRVLAVLAEKEALTPDTYPMSLNGLTNGCNQLSSRDPVMQLSEEKVHDVLQSLMQRKLVNGITQAGARVAKYEHRMRIKWNLEQDKVALLTVLMLRGVQTAGELRTRTARLFEFKSIADVEVGLQFLIDKYPPLVARLERAPGTKEPRYGHLLSGDAALAQQETAASYAASLVVPAPDSRIALLEAEVAMLRDQVGRLAAQFDLFKQQFD